MKVDDEINDVANKREIENTKQQTTNKPKIKIPEQNYYNKSPNKLADYQLKTYRHPIGTYPGMYDVPGSNNNKINILKGQALTIGS